MSDIKNKSGILPWHIEGVQSAPAKPGVYVLRTATDVASIIYIGSSENIEKRLREIFLSSEIPGVSFFDWYETETVDKAIPIERKWIQDYKPKLNLIS
ncbi:hypothetical protein A3A37_01710 [Candidatus Kaiserbacteria bacterium RIFCSPLOWO2_01_FULL_52_36]|nr:MAG: hypothetical protein A3A37_01710 [Candidatus Kaiserbacteria bacterium RIFCSPLOWO2_01_FULL_52_36]